MQLFRSSQLLTPSPSATSLASASGGGGGGGKGKGKDKKAAKGGKGKKEAAVEEGRRKGADGELDVDALDDELEIDESGDVRLQSLNLLTKSGDSLGWLGRFEEACSAHLAACEAAGSALNDGKPLDAFKSLVKAQASGSSAWMEEIKARSSCTDPSSRERLFSRKLARSDRDRGEKGLFSEDR